MHDLIIQNMSSYAEWPLSGGKFVNRNFHILQELRKRKENKQQSQKKEHQPTILCFVGLVGTGKTTFGPSLAEALGRKYVRIPFGGLGSALDLRGQSRLHPDAEPGLIIKALKRAGSCNPVMLLDEIDRVTDAARAVPTGLSRRAAPPTTPPRRG